MTRALAALAAAWWCLAPASADAATVNVIRVEGFISDGVGAYIEKSIERSEAEGAAALVIQLDTPGGVLSTTKDIVSAMLNAEVPIVVFVSPRGAWAASAGTFITMAGHVAAMAPGTSIGAAHPVSAFGGGPSPVPPQEGEEGQPAPQPAVRDFANEKIENFTAAFIESIAEERERNVEWAIEAVRNSVAIKQSEAVELNVVDLVADDLDQLLDAIDGRQVKLGSGPVALQTRGARVVRIEMELMDRFFATISNPSVAFLLLVAGAAGLYMELQAPGLIIPGVIGVICLIMAGLAFQIIPINWTGALLMLAGLILLVAEVFITSYGVLFAAGVGCFAWGAYLMFQMPAISDLTLPFWGTVAPAVAVMAVFMAIVLIGVGRSYGRPQYFGREGLVGELAIAEDDLSPEGHVSLHGERWLAEAVEPVRRGERVEIVEVRDLTMRVRPARSASGSRDQTRG